MHHLTGLDLGFSSFSASSHFCCVTGELTQSLQPNKINGKFTIASFRTTRRSGVSSASLLPVGLIMPPHRSLVRSDFRSFSCRSWTLSSRSSPCRSYARSSPIRLLNLINRTYLFMLIVLVSRNASIWHCLRLLWLSFRENHRLSGDRSQIRGVAFHFNPWQKLTPDRGTPNLRIVWRLCCRRKNLQVTTGGHNCLLPLWKAFS